MATHEAVAHRWALDDASARTIKSRLVFYSRDPAYGSTFPAGSEENVIYSHGYHFPAAAFQTAPDGSRIVLFSTQSYSVSTGHHQRIIWSAIPSNRVKVLMCKHVSPRHMSRENDMTFHEANVADFVKKIGFYMASAKKRRADNTRDHDLGMADRNARQLREYAETFRLESYLTGDNDALIARATAEAEARDVAIRAEQARQAEARKAYQLERQVEQAAQFSAWTRGEPHVRCPDSYRVGPDRGAYLRRVGDMLQTSQGAEVPWNHAVRVFQFVKLCMERGEGFQANGRTIRVGHYTVDSITVDGTMVAGCHRIAWREIERLARAEGVFALDSDSSAVTHSVAA